MNFSWRSELPTLSRFTLELCTKSWITTNRRTIVPLLLQTCMGWTRFLWSRKNKAWNQNWSSGQRAGKGTVKYHPLVSIAEILLLENKITTTNNNVKAHTFTSAIMYPRGRSCFTLGRKYTIFVLCRFRLLRTNNPGTFIWFLIDPRQLLKAALAVSLVMVRHVIQSCGRSMKPAFSVTQTKRSTSFFLDVQPI